jgi:hypothetical protein
MAGPSRGGTRSPFAMPPLQASVAQTHRFLAANDKTKLIPRGEGSRLILSQPIFYQLAWSVRERMQFDQYGRRLMMLSATLLLNPH